MNPGAARASSRWAHRLAGLSLALPLLAQAGGEGDPRAWLERMHQAASTGNYQGTMVVSAGGSMSSSRVWHYCVGEQSYERIEAQDGRQQRVFRHNDEVRTLWPQARVALIEKREALAPWSATPQSVEPRALENYELRREGAGRIAGRDAAVFLLEPRDPLRFAQRLWADQATGLMLRADVLGPAGQPLESTAFSEVEIGVRPQPEMVLKAMRKIDAQAAETRLEPRADLQAGARADGRGDAAREGWRVLRPPLRRTRLEAEGWTMRQTVPGFTLAGCAMRAIGPDEAQVLQAVFSDGLTHVSLFIEPFKPERHRQPTRQAIGATTTLTQRQGEFWITAVGDVPAATLQQFTDALERRR